MSAPLLPTEDPRDRRIAELEALLAQRDRQLAALQQQVRDLQAQVAEAARTAKRQAAPFARRERKPNPQKPGRKKGQGRFARRALPGPEQVQVTKEAPLPACPGCGGDLTERRQHEQFEVEIPPVQPIVTCFVTHSGYCPACAKRVHSVHPEQTSTAHGAAGVVLGPRVKALAADLHHRLGLSYGKIVDLLREAFDLPVTRGGLAQADAHLAALAQCIYEELLTLLRQSSVVHVDETGWRIGVLSAWLWVFTNQRVTVYAIRRSRGHEVVLEILGRQFAGVLVADCFLAYDAAALEEWLQQKCVAHLLRELRELAETKRGRAAQFAVDLMSLLREALVLKAGARDIRAPAYEAAAGALEERLDRLLEEQGVRDADQLRLIKRLGNHRPDILRFLYWEELEATNNQAERDLRPAVPLRKVGGCQRSADGATAHEVLASVLATCRKQALNILDYLVKLQQFGATLPSLAPV
jgi:hypothetical protein